MSILQTVTRSVGLRADSPWLPAGEPLRARVFREGLTPASGVAWLDNAGVDDAVVMLTAPGRIAGAAPPVTGMALRVLLPDGEVGDLVLRMGAPRPRRAGRPGRHPVLVTGTPYAGPTELVSVRARRAGAETFALDCLVGDGEWTRFADLRISSGSAGGTWVPEPDLNLLPGLEPTAAAPYAS